MVWKLALRHLTRHWRLNLILLSIMVLGAALLSSLPMLAVTIAGESLALTLENAPVQVRNIVIRGKSKSDDLPENVEETIGPFLKDSLAVREGQIPALPIFFQGAGTERYLHPATMVLILRSFGSLEDRVRIIEGRLPEPGTMDPTRARGDIPIIEAAIGTETARRTGLVLGDEVSPMTSTYHLRIVGIVEPLDPKNQVWWSDNQMLPFTTWRRIYTLPDIDEWNISLIVHPQIKYSQIIHSLTWRLVVDHQLITVSNAPMLRKTLTALQSELSDQELILRTGLIDLILRFENQFSLVQVSLVLLTFQSLVAAFYVIGMFGNFLVEQSSGELATLAGRGYTRSQITGLFARSSILLAVLAGATGPTVARGFLVLWANSQGYPPPTLIPVESWGLSLATGLFSWLFLLISIYRAAGQDFILLEGGGMRDVGRAMTQRHLIWDIFILTLGGLAYWQLVQGSAILGEIAGTGGDPGLGSSDIVLLLGPSLLLIAASLLSIRLLSLIWRFFSWISNKGRGFLWSGLFSRFSRSPVSPSQITLLVSLTAGLTLFASALTTSIQDWQGDMARFMVGADIRLQQPMEKATEDLNLPGATGISGKTEVIRATVPILVDEFQVLDFDLFAVDLDSFPSVVSYPPGISAYSIGDILNVIKTDTPNVLPVVISSNATTHHLNIGDNLTWNLGSNSYLLEIVGIIINFPLADRVFAITDLSAFTQQVDLSTLVLTDRGSRETWMAVEPDKNEAVLNALIDAGFGDQIAGNSKAQMRILQNNLVYREVLTAFELNALFLVPLSVVGFSLIQTHAAQGRSGEFGILRAMGFSKSQRRGMLLLEGLIFIFLGLILGTGIGFGLTRLMEPYLSQILPPLRGDLYLTRILFNWGAVGIRYAALVLLYGIALFAIITRAVRNQSSGQP